MRNINKRRLKKRHEARAPKPPTWSWATDPALPVSFSFPLPFPFSLALTVALLPVHGWWWRSLPIKAAHCHGRGPRTHVGPPDTHGTATRDLGVEGAERAHGGRGVRRRGRLAAGLWLRLRLGRRRRCCSCCWRRWRRGRVRWLVVLWLWLSAATVVFRGRVLEEGGDVHGSSSVGEQSWFNPGQREKSRIVASAPAGRSHDRDQSTRGVLGPTPSGPGVPSIDTLSRI